MTGGKPRGDIALDVVITNWNSGDHLRRCIEALSRSTIASRLHVTVVDNSSGDGSAGALSGELSLEVIRNAENRGFAAACNQGAARGCAPLLLFLNPDTRVAPDALANALAFLAAPEQRGTGIIGARLVNQAGHAQRTCARAPTVAGLIGQNAGLDRILPSIVRPHFLSDWDHEDTRPVDQVMGAFLLIRRALFEQLRGFDERYFVYFDDVDLCRRARLTGAAVVHFAGASAWHEGGGTTSQVKDRRLFYMLRSQVLYVDKWHGHTAALVALASALAVHVPLRVAKALASFSLRDANHALRGGRLLIRELPAILRALGRSTAAQGASWAPPGQEPSQAERPVSH